MTLKRRLILNAVLVLCVTTVGTASPFVNPPEHNPMIPNGGWVGSFPYQRNAIIDFATDPGTWAADANDPSRKELDPTTNYHLEGEDDPILYPSDWSDGTGDVYWYNDDPTGTGTGRQGMVGFYDFSIAAGTLTWHLDNWPAPNRWKHVYIEMEYYADGSASWALGINAAAPAIVIGDQVGLSFQDLGGGWYRSNIWVPIEPNPLWEEISIDLDLDEFETGSILIDYIHVATECVPEPTTLSLLPVGGLILIRRRKR